MNEHIERYQQLLDERPDLFPPTGDMARITDPDEMEGYAAAHGREVGVVYESPWHYLIVDLVGMPDGGLRTYERYVSVARNAGAVFVPKVRDGFLLIRQLRYTTGRDTLAFPRGFADGDERQQEAAARECVEELGAEPLSVTRIGSTIPDTGVSG